MIGFGSSDTPDVVTVTSPDISKSSGTVILTVAPASNGLLFYTIKVTFDTVLIVTGYAVTSALDDDPLTGIVAYNTISLVLA